MTKRKGKCIYKNLIEEAVDLMYNDLKETTFLIINCGIKLVY